MKTFAKGVNGEVFNAIIAYLLNEPMAEDKEFLVLSRESGCSHRSFLVFNHCDIHFNVLVVLENSGHGLILDSICL